MVDPDDITNFGRTQWELEEVLVFWICVAGKTAATISKAVENVRRHLNGGRRAPRPGYFELLRRVPPEKLPEILKSHGIGCYNLKAKGLAALARSGLDLKTCTYQDLRRIPGCGRKTAKCFLIHSRKESQDAGLDTHVMKALRRRGFRDVPVATPGSEKQYAYWERIVLGLTREEGKTVAGWDLDEWKAGKNEKKEGNKMFTMKLVGDLFPSIADGSKRCTIRAHKRDIPLGSLRFEQSDGSPDDTFSDQWAVVEIVEVRHKKLGELTDEEARMDGASTAAEMKVALRRFYPDLTDEDDITIAIWK
jgi:endonuclease III